ncbi:hypothetical protein INR49_029140, partial [Caranx melampygus]
CSTGLFRLSSEEFFIQPLEKPSDDTSVPQAHAIYKRHVPPSSWSPVVKPISGKQALNGTCGLKNSHQSLEDSERQRERWEHRQQRRRRIRQRSVSKEKWVETLVVADPKMVEYHGSKAVEGYVLAVMNIVAGLFRDASIGNAVNIVVVRLILLEQDEDDLKITHHADNSLNSFCKWQKKLNMKGDEHPLHHDVAVLLTRKDICAAINMPCETLGLSHVAGMCQPHRSCSISEDTGLPVAFTVAHELGHNFGIQHDGNGNDCEPIGKRPFVMSPQLLYGTSLPRWSHCSRQYITRFLDAAHQCRLQYGSSSLLCDDMDNVCSTLWCTVGTTCHSKLDGAVDGTSCGEGKWCFSGVCVAFGLYPESVNGGWASWSEWSTCSRTCGAGVQSAQRDCDNPVPKNRGKYCLGERRRYKICNINPCPRDLPSFRDMQCSHFNTMPYKGKFYKWEAVINRGYVDIGLIPEGARDIHIEEVAEAGNFLALRSDNPNKYFLNGGWTIQWNGDYKAAGTVFTYVRTGHLENLTSPGPTMEPLWVQETNPGVRYEYTISQNLSEDNDVPVSHFFWKYGSWTECSVTCGAGVQRQIVHCVEKTTGIVEEHLCDPLTRPDDNQTSCSKDPCPAIWWVGEWQKCSASCGSSGLTKRTVLCIQAVSAEEQEALQPSECKHMPKPESLSSCNTHIPCPADWSTGSWSKCSLTCGSGERHRNVTCSRNTGSDCDPQKKPVAVSTCYVQDCPQVVDNFGGIDWSGSGWSSKEVLNEINSIPEAKPPPKFSITRAQPRNHNDLNNIVEGDFHYHNKIENIDQNSVQVDDFYYDYNFINFHEDLSDDFESDGKDHTLNAPQLDDLTRREIEYAMSETTRAPTTNSVISTVSKTTAVILNPAEPQTTDKVDKVKDVRAQETEIHDDYEYSLNEKGTPGPDVSVDNESAESPEPEGSPRPDTIVQKSTPLSIPSLLSPGNREASEDSTSLTGIEIIPPTDLEGATQPPPADFLPAQMEQIPTKPVETTGTSSTSQEPPFDLADFDYSEIVVPPMVGGNGNSDPGLSHQLPTNSALTSQSGTTPAKPTDSPTPVVLLLPTPPPSSASTQVATAAFWVTGNWSACSTSCGLGAVWRTLACSTGLDSDCDPAKRPPPAQRCYLRPCSSWKVGEWSKCSKNCESGIKSREVQCFDMRDQRPLRPFHCRAMSSRPLTQIPCNLQPCLDWYTSSWGQCSEICGGGEQQRIVTCPEEDRCNKDLQPSNIQSCNSQPCAQWLTGSWGQCSASCGGGVQHRLIKCVNTKPETHEEVDQYQCENEVQPKSSRKCNIQECEGAPSGTDCLRDRLTFRFCQTLRLLSRCHLPNVTGKGSAHRPLSLSKKPGLQGRQRSVQPPGHRDESR